MAKVETDVVIVGGGGAGLAAAVTAARLGRRVVLLEKNPSLGGTTARSVGSVTSSCTALQKAAGIDDDPQAHFEDLPKFAGDLATRDNVVLRRLLTENMPETMRFLTDLGIEFFGPMPEPPHRVPRMHNILPHSRAYIYHLARHARKDGADLRTGVRVNRLLQEDDRVTGVEAAGDTFRARRGVVVASGDYSGGESLKRSFDPALGAIEGINETSTGDGQRMLQEVGAEIVNGDIMTGPEIRFVRPPRKPFLEALPPGRPMAKFMRWSLKYMPDNLLRPFFMIFVTTNLAPSPALFEAGAILVNRDGSRFCDERRDPQRVIPDQPGKIAYILFDQQVAQRFSAWPHFVSTAPGIAYAYVADYRRNRKDVYAEAPTLEALAAQLNMPDGMLAQTVSAYNQDLDARGNRPALTEPPFVALGPAKSWIVMTEGGVRVNERLEVLDAEGTPIPGLFAAGSAGQGGLLLEGHGHHLGWAFTSGRIAGRNAAFAAASQQIGRTENV